MRKRFAWLGSLLLGSLMLAGAARAAPPEPAPPYPPPPPRAYRHGPPPRYGPPPRVVGSPPPLSPLMRALYAPFYAAGLVVRYGVYYVIVAPLEVFSRTVTYGVQGGVERPPPRPPHRDDDES